MFNAMTSEMEANFIRLSETYIKNCQPIADQIMAAFGDGLELTEGQACYRVEGKDKVVSGIFRSLVAVGRINETGRFRAGSHIYSL